jgi:hypothetical protein
MFRILSEPRKQILVFALYRTPLASEVSFALPYVNNCPRRGTILRAGDRLFIYCNPMNLDYAKQAYFQCPLNVTATSTYLGTKGLDSLRPAAELPRRKNDNSQDAGAGADAGVGAGAGRGFDESIAARMQMNARPDNMNNREVDLNEVLLEAGGGPGSVPEYSNSNSNSNSNEEGDGNGDGDGGATVVNGGGCVASMAILQTGPSEQLLPLSSQGQELPLLSLSSPQPSTPIESTIASGDTTSVSNKSRRNDGSSNGYSVSGDPGDNLGHSTPPVSMSVPMSESTNLSTVEP